MGARDLPEPMWAPDAEAIAATHIGAALAELKFNSYDALYRWSIASPASFWRHAIDAIGVAFSISPDAQSDRAILDASKSVENPDWLIDAKLNIAESCFNAPPDAAAVIEGGVDGTFRTSTYGEIRSLANRVAQGICRLGIKPHDAVAVFLPMNTESVAIYLGIVLAGCCVISIADSFSAEHVASRLRIGKAQLVFTVDFVRRGSKSLPVYDRVVEAGGPRAVVIESERPLALGSRGVLRRAGDVAWRDFLPSTSTDLAVQATSRTPMNILFSSGTTGEPKAIVWDHTTPIKAAVDGYFHQDIHPGDVVAWPTNLGWMMGPWLIFATLINRGTIALYTDVPTEFGFAQFVERARIRILGVIPSLVRAWRESGSIEKCDWTGIKTLSSTGECSNADDMRWLSALAGGKPVIEYCGGTEIGGGYIASTLVQANFPSTFSTPTLGTALVLLDEQGKPADQGEAFLVPPALGFSRCLLNRDHHEVYFGAAPLGPNGELLRRHGDEFRRLSNGYYQALGRVDDTMNLGGIKVSAAEIERAASGTPGVRELAAIAISPQGGGPSQLALYVALESPDSMDVASLRDTLQSRIRSRLNPLFKIHEVILVDRLPRTASNKIMRRKLRETAHHGTPLPDERS